MSLAISVLLHIYTYIYICMYIYIHTHTMKYYSALKRIEILIHVTTVNKP